MKKRIVTIILMALSTLPTLAQIDLHSHAVTQGYLDTQKAVVILHPHKPSAVNAQLIADVPLASYEYLAETSRAILNMIAHNVLVRYPNLKVVVPHCGSFLPNALPRFRSLLPVMVKQGIMQPVDVDANLSRLYYDLAGAPTEIYADKEAYQSHLQTAHFKKYKEGTVKMVKSLKLIDTNPMVGMEMLGR
jgi:hypothetical protein